MRHLKIFFLFTLLLSGCKGSEEEVIGLDEMVIAEEELAEELLAGEPQESTQELPFKEPETF